jgi:hypothetical protein
MTKAQLRLRQAERILMIENMLQDYTLETVATPGEGASTQPVFRHTTQDILDKVLQHYPEELTDRIAAGKDGHEAKEQILVEIQRRAKRMKDAGLVAGFKPRSATPGPMRLTPSQVTDWLRDVQNIRMLSDEQMRSIDHMVSEGIRARRKR